MCLRFWQNDRLNPLHARSGFWAVVGITIVSLQPTKLMRGRCAACCALHCLTHATGQLQCDCHVQGRPSTTTEESEVADDGNSLLASPRDSSTLACCQRRVVWTPDAARGREASGHVPWAWPERRQPSPRAKGSSLEWEYVNSRATMVIVNPDKTSTCGTPRVSRLVSVGGRELFAVDDLWVIGFERPDL